MMIKSFAANLLIMVYSTVYGVLYCSTLFRGNLVCSAQTQGLAVTQSIDSSSDGVTLDCPVQYNKLEDQKLIFKWYYNNDPQPIYQWIVDKSSRIYSPKIEQFVDQNYTVDDQTTRYRALRFTNLNLKLNGNYTCIAHSLNENYDDINIRLIIYVGAKDLNVDVQRVDNGVNVTCSASGLFPMPELTLYRYPNNDSNLIQITQNTTTVTEGESGKYSIWLTSIISEDNSHSSDIPDHYECRLQLPDTDYMLQKTVALQAGWHTRPHHDSSSNKSYEIHFVLLTASLVLPLLAVIINIS